MTGIIYCGFDVKTGKFYVGQTWSSLEKRVKQHHSRFSDCRALREVLQTRKDDFVWSILAELSTQDELNAAELYWGTQLEALHPYGYVLRLGHSRGKMSLESRAKMSKTRKGRKLPSSQLRGLESYAESLRGTAMSAGMRQKVSEGTRRGMTVEVRSKISKANSTRVVSEETRAKMSASQLLRRQRENF